jgi:hypothetical protein
MRTLSKVIAWLCILSTLSMGCYSTSALTDPRGAEKNQLYSGQIQSVVTMDGKKYQFNKPPIIINDTIVGEAETRVTALQASIPTSDVAELG